MPMRVPCQVDGQLTLRCGINVRRQGGGCVSDGQAVPGQPVTRKELDEGQAKRPYAPPRLVRYGDVRDVTLGPSFGSGESGNPTFLRA